MVSLQIKPNTYYDSITLMIISKELKKVPGVKEALVGMGTDLNLDIAKVTGLSSPELEAITHIFDELKGNEGILVASRIADSVGITRSVIVNALRKFESAGVIESRSSGMKGTYIKVLNDYIFDELDEIKARKNLKGKGDAHPDETKK